MHPYEANHDNIPDTDRYYQDPLYGRYLPRDDDFKPEPKYINSQTPEALAYWEGVLQRCDKSVRIFDFPGLERDIFALGSVIVKSGHLRPLKEGEEMALDYSVLDANDVAAVTRAKEGLSDTGIAVPEIFFSGKIRGRDVLIESRIPGVSLEVAWPYLTPEQKGSFKTQIRGFLHRINTLSSPFENPSYVVPDPNPESNHDLDPVDRLLLFRGINTGNLGLMHNHLTKDKIIVNNNKIVGVIDWKRAGYFGLARSAYVHEWTLFGLEVECSAHFSGEKLAELLFWNDLYKNTAAF